VYFCHNLGLIYFKNSARFFTVKLMRKSPRGEGDQSVQNCSTSTGTSKD
jgi:hypothetical protein